MNIKYATILIFLFSSWIECNSINVDKLLPAYSLNMTSMISEIRSIVTAFENKHFGKDFISYITIILPTADDNTIMPQIMEKTAQELGSKWIITANDSFCCDTYEPIRSMGDPTLPMIVEYTPDLYIISLREHDGINYLDAQLKLMSEENSFNPRAIFLLVTLTHSCGEYKDNTTTLYFNQMWKKNCLSVVMLALSECDFKITIITATPFSDTNTCRNVQENGTQQYYSNWHDKGISVYKTDHRNFNKCNFSVGTIPSPPYVIGKPDSSAKPRYEFVGGIDLELLNLASYVYNFTYVFDVHHGFGTDAMGTFLPNGSMVGIFVDLIEKNIDICVGGIIPFHFNFYKYDYSNYYKFSYFGWNVNDASLAPQWKIFFGAFSQVVWVIFCFVFVATSCLYSLLDYFVSTYFTRNCHNHTKKKFFVCHFEAIPLIQYFSVTLGLSSTLKPKSTCLRVLYFAWNIYSLHMSIAYSSMLFMFISNPPLEKEIKTLDDLEHAGLKTGAELIVFQRFSSAELDRKTRSIMEDRFTCPKWKSCVEDLIKHKNFSLLIKKDLLEYYINTKQSKVHSISEVFFSYGSSVMASKGNPLDPRFDKMALLVFQSGLVDKWDRDTKSKFNREHMKDGIKSSENSATILTVHDLKGTFLILVSGIATSTLSMFGELVVSFLQKRHYDKQT